MDLADADSARPIDQVRHDRCREHRLLLRGLPAVAAGAAVLAGALDRVERLGGLLVPGELLVHVQGTTHAVALPEISRIVAGQPADDHSRLSGPGLVAGR